MNDLEKKLAFPAVRETIILRYQVSFFLCICMCSCSEIDIGFSNKYGKKLDLKVLKDIMPSLFKCFLSFRDVL